MSPQRSVAASLLLLLLGVGLEHGGSIVLTAAQVYKCHHDVRPLPTASLPETVSTVNGQYNTDTGHIDSNEGTVSLTCPNGTFVWSAESSPQPTLSVECRSDGFLYQNDSQKLSVLLGCTAVALCVQYYTEYDTLKYEASAQMSLQTKATIGGAVKTLLVAPLDENFSVSCDKPDLEVWTSSGPAPSKLVTCVSGSEVPVFDRGYEYLPRCYPPLDETDLQKGPTCNITIVTIPPTSLEVTNDSARFSEVTVNGNEHLLTLAGSGRVQVACGGSTGPLELYDDTDALISSLEDPPSFRLTCKETANSEKYKVWSLEYKPDKGGDKLSLQNNGKFYLECLGTTTTAAAPSTTTVPQTTTDTTATTTDTTATTTDSVLPETSTSEATTTGVTPTTGSDTSTSHTTIQTTPTSETTVPTTLETTLPTTSATTASTASETTLSTASETAPSTDAETTLFTASETVPSTAAETTPSNASTTALPTTLDAAPTNSTQGSEAPTTEETTEASSKGVIGGMVLCC